MTNPFQTLYKTDIEDELLVKNILEGDKKSLDNLIGKHQDWIYNIAIRMIYHPIDAEDITQEVLIKIISKLSTYDKNKSSFRTWLYKIVKNHIINFKSKKESYIRTMNV